MEFNAINVDGIHDFGSATIFYCFVLNNHSYELQTSFINTGISNTKSVSIVIDTSIPLVTRYRSSLNCLIKRVKTYQSGFLVSSVSNEVLLKAVRENTALLSSSPTCEVHALHWHKPTHVFKQIIVVNYFATCTGA